MDKLYSVIHCFATYMVPVVSIFLMQSCIKEDLSNCVNEELLLYVKVVDVITGEDITETGDLEDVCLYLFDHTEHFWESYMVSASRIKQREPIILKNYDPQGMVVSAWGSLGDRINISGAYPGSETTDMSVSLVSNPEEPGYDLSPDNFFFGFKRIGQQKVTRRCEEVILSAKNAKLHITVRGLEERNEEDYYFRIINQHNGYDFQGLPIPKISTIKEKGIFNSRHEYVSSDPYLLIHSANPALSSGAGNIWVYLYKTEITRSLEIVGTYMDSMGNYISLTSGKTTNVLIDITESGEFLVYIQITPWDEIYQWTEY